MTRGQGNNMKSSIAVTTYNGSKYIVELLSSIMNQTRMPDEVIICDDVSTDNTVSIVKEFIRKNELTNWFIISNENNIGWKRNFRNVVERCTGDIILFCDQDDIWHKDKLEVMCGIIEQNRDVKVLISNYYLLSQGSKKTKAKKSSKRDDGKLEHLQGKKRIGTISRPGCTFAFTREMVKIMLQYDNVNCGHDHVIYNLGLITNSLYIVNRQLIDYRRHTSNASTYKMKFGKERKALEAKDRVDICDILLNYCKSDKDKTKEKAVQNRRDFYSKRLDILKNGNVLKMFLFVISNIRQYWSVREIAVDLIAMLR